MLLSYLKGVKGAVSKILRFCSIKMSMIYLHFESVVDHYQWVSCLWARNKDFSLSKLSACTIGTASAALIFSAARDGWWCEHHKNCCSWAKKANGRLEYLAFDIFPLYLMLLLFTLINVTLIFMSVAVRHKLCYKLLLMVTFLHFLAELDKNHRWFIPLLRSMLIYIFIESQVSFPY